MKLLRFLLFPFAIIYDVVTSIRNYTFDLGIFKSTSFKIPVIAVGNLSVGGTGKTPQIEYLISLLQKDYNIAVLSRGYKRKTKGFLLLDDSHSAVDVGDEPLQFYKKFSNIKVAVDTNRANGIQQLLEHDNTLDLILLDDAFQHRKVKASFYILLTKFNDLYTSDFLLPTGNLRESSKGAKRADITVVTKCPENLSKTEKENIKSKLKSKNPTFFSTIIYDDSLKGDREFSFQELKEYKVILVTGIANPKPFVNYLSSQNIHFNHISYPDHHNFTASDINKIQTTFNSLSSYKKIILTTEKDYIRLEDKLKDLVYLPIKSSIIDDKITFDSLIFKHIKV